MNKNEANRLLDEVKLGIPVPIHLINLALIVTGDLQTNYEIRTN
jgi:hypothetical protein